MKQKIEPACSGSLLGDILDIFPSHISLLDADGRIVAVNESWRRFGRENGAFAAAGFVGCNYVEVCENSTGPNGEEGPAIAGALRQILAGKRADYTVEYPCHSKQEKRWFRLTVSALKGHPEARVLVRNVNITPGRLAEESLEISEEQSRRTSSRLSELLENLPDGFFTLGKDWCFRYLNAEAERLLMPSGGELVGQCVWEAFPESVGSIFQREYERALRENVMVEFPGFYEPLGILFEVRAYPTEDGLAVYFRDVTARRRTDDAVRMQVQMLEQIGQGVIATDLDARVNYANRFAGELYGVSPEEMTGRNIIDVMDPQTSGTLRRERMGRLKRGENWSGESLMKRSNGEVLSVAFTDSPLLDENGSRVGNFSVSSDITVREEREANLRQKDVLIRIAERVTRTGGWALELEGEKLFWSDTIFDLMEMQPGDEPQLGDALSFYPEPGHSRMAGALAQCAAEGVPFDMEVEILTAKGRRIWVRACGEAERDESGTIRRVQGALQDLTERNRMQTELQQMALRLSSTLENMSDAFYLLDREWRFEYLNTEAERLLQATRDAVLGRVIWEVFPEWLMGTAHGRMHEVVNYGQPAHFEIYSEASGDWYAVNAYPAAESVAVYFRVITQAKLAEFALERSNRALKTLSRCSEAVIRSESEVDLLGKICRIATETGGFHRAWVGYALEDGAKTIAPQAWSGTEDGYLAEVTIQWAEDAPEGQGPAGRAVREGHWIQVPDFTADERLAPWASEAAKRGFRGGIALPLKDGAKTFGVLVLYLAEVRTAEADELQLLQEIADEMAHAIVNLRLRSERKLARDQIAQQARLLDKAQDAILVCDLDLKILYWNQSAERVYGWTADEALERTTAELLKPDLRTIAAATKATIKNGEWLGELSQIRKDGTTVVVEARWTLVGDDDGAPGSILSICTDITERKILEDQFLRVQRMESIGTLAGGIAHDLNNVLAPIMMSIDLLRSEIRSEDGLEVLDLIGKSALRGADMVRQVLTFARGVEGMTQDVEVGSVIHDAVRIIQETFPKQVRAECHIADDLWLIRGDPTQIHQVVLNLCVNSRDAMPHGGRIILRATNRMIDGHYAGMNIEAAEGPHILIEVEDTGHGISPEIIHKLYDPFFTTKEVGKGTGLGLSTSLAIIKSHGGFIRAYSEPGRGAKFRIYLPAAPGPGPAVAEAAAVSHPHGHGETVLVVDDEDAIRQITRKTLEAYGYQVLLACDGSEAISVYVANQERVAAVLTDMMMPVMDGATTIQVLRRLNPALPIIGASGVDESESIAGSTQGPRADQFLAKPYSAETLLNALRSVLSESAADG